MEKIKYSYQGLKMLTWTHSISTGVEAIDKEHQLLFKKFNDLESALASYSLREAGEILGFLQVYADMHFDEEEREMEAKHCAAADQNKREHDDFRKKFGSLYRQWQGGKDSVELFQTTYNELEKWLLSHIMEIDRQLYLHD